jgi:superfamily II DNA or RNA helicase
MNNLLQSQQREISQFNQLSDWLAANKGGHQTVHALLQITKERKPVSLIDKEFDLDAFQMRLSQRFNPYPNMSRHRVLYLFAPCSDALPNKTFGESGLCVQVYKGYVRPDQSYFCKNQLNITQQLAASAKKKPPTFITELDLLIFQRLQRHGSIDREDMAIYLSEQSLSSLWLTVIDTGRAFWRSCDKGPLSSSDYLLTSCNMSAIEQSGSLNNSHVGGKHSSAQVEIVTEDLKLDIENNRVIREVDFKMLERSIQPLLSPDDYLAEHQSQHSIRLLMTVDSFEGESSQLAERSFDFIRISVEVAGKSYDLNSLLTWYQAMVEPANGTNQPEIVAFLERILCLIQTLDPVVANFPVGAHSRMSSTDLVLDSPLDFDWFQECIKAGFNIEFAASFRLLQMPELDWFVQIGSSDAIKEGQETYSVDLGLIKSATKGKSKQHVDLLPYLKQPIAQLNQLCAESSVLEVEIGTNETIRIPVAQVEIIRHFLADWAESKAANQSMNVHQCMRLSQLADQLKATVTSPPSLQRRLESWRLLSLGEAKALPNRLVLNQEALSDHIQLRDYQVEGVNWMAQLDDLGLGGILADDMGLGKTLQILSYIVSANSKPVQLDNAKTEYKSASNSQADIEQMSSKKPSLIVMPTSLLNNWLNEVVRFAPHLEVAVYHGANRSHLRQQIQSDSNRYDLVLTTYNTLHRDIAHLQIPWWLIVFDEAQTLKNPKSKIRRCVQSLTSQQTFCLSGTPMENHLGELWSLTDLVVPGFLGSYAQFQRLYRKPIEHEPESELAINRLKSLMARIGPLMLRRTKAQVAQELPPKTQIDVTLPLTLSQAQQYESVRLATLKSVRAAVASDVQGAQILVSNAILKLRQICCHHTIDESTSLNSCKIDWLNEHLPEMIETGRRVLIFSTFTKMLDAVSVALDALGIEYAMLTGKSRDRAPIIDSFQTGKKPVFLISLKAGGVGLNLTQADTVIHTDPWWNPAAEQQATDRAHRIGQDKPVFVYRLSAENTIETHIHQLQNKKRLLSNQVLGEEALAGSRVDSQTRFQQWIKLLEQPL